MAHPELVARVNALLVALGQATMHPKAEGAVEEQLSATLGGEEHLLVLSEEEGSTPKAILINVPNFSAGVASMAAGYVQGGLIGAASALIAIWSLGNTASSLPPGAALITWILVEAPDHAMGSTELKATYLARRASLGVSQGTDDSDAILHTLAMSQVIGLEGDEVILREVSVTC